MVRQRVTRLANPRGRRRKSNSQVSRNRAGQFVKRRKASGVRRKIKTAVRNRKANAKRRARRSNPVLITLGAINPHAPKRRKAKVARRTRRKANSTTRRRRRRANPVAVAPRRRRRAVVRRRRRSNPVAHHVTRRRRRRATGYHRRRRNPSVFGRSVTSVGGVEAILGGLIGVTAAKILPTYIPASMLGSPIMRVLASGASAWAASLAIGKLRPGMSDAVMFGGLMQTASVALNLFIPSIGGQIGLSGYRNGMGDLVEGNFVVPQNPLRYIPAPLAPQAPQARVNMNGIARSFGSAF